MSRLVFGDKDPWYSGKTWFPADEETGSGQEFIWNFRRYFKQLCQIPDLSFLVCLVLFSFKYDKSHIFEEW